MPCPFFQSTINNRQSSIHKVSVTLKKQYRKSKRPPRSGKRKLVRSEDQYVKPKIDQALNAVFEKIGVPGETPFIPDPFQLEAVDLVQNDDVLVSAPTGSGKTWIAVQTIRSYLSRGLNVWYASPLKALSNSIYQEFAREFGRAPAAYSPATARRMPTPP